MQRSLTLVAFALMVGCASHAPEHHAGTGTIHGTITGLILTTEHAVSIARSLPPDTEIKLAPSEVACEATQASDRITIDLGGSAVGRYTVVSGYPSRALLSAAQARAHACPAKSVDGQGPCHEAVRGGEVIVTRFDPEPGGKVEGTYTIDLADGSVSGSFAALRCD